MRQGSRHRKLLFASTLCWLGVATAFGQAQTTADVQVKVVETASQPTVFDSQHFEKGGIAVDFNIKSIGMPPSQEQQTPHVKLTAGMNALVTIRVTDARTGHPLTNVHPKVWVVRRKTTEAPNESQCVERIRNYISGQLGTGADIDLNSFRLLTLNGDKTIMVINPQASFSVTKMESIIELPGIGADWVLSPDKSILYVTLPDQSSVAIINTPTRKLINILPTGDQTKPTRIAVQPDGRYVWVGLDNSPRVAAIDTATNKVTTVIDVGNGLHNLAFSADSHFTFITNSADDSVSVIDAKTLRKLADLKVGQTPVALAYSAASQLVYVASINAGSISAIDASRLKVVANIPATRGIVALRFMPEGRFAVTVNQLESTISVLDAATNTILASTPVVKEPDQVTFTQSYAYIRGLGSEKFTLLDLNELKQSRLTPIDIQAGRLAPSFEPEKIGVAQMIAPTPEGNSVMIANAPDKMIYFYVEGMMAPMGTFDNYKRSPLALMILDNSLTETSAGVYSAAIKLTAGGPFDVPVLIEQPRLTKCFQLEVVGPSVNPDATAIHVAALFKGAIYKAAHPVALGFKITDIRKQPVIGLKDVRVLVFEPPGLWQQRQWASETSPGIYEVKQIFPHAGRFAVMVSVDSHRLIFTDVPSTIIKVIGKEEAPSQKILRKIGEKEDAQ